MPWGVAAAALGVAGSAASGIIGSNAAGDAAKAQIAGGNNAIGTEQLALQKSSDLLSPYAQGGGNAFADLQRLLGIGSPGGPSSPLLQMLGIGQGGQPTTTGVNPTAFQMSPGYQFQVQEGNNAVVNNAQGNLGGNTLRALMQQGQQTANQGWQQYLGNVGGAWQQQVGNVAGVANTGFNATNTLAGDTLSTGRNVGSIQIGQGNAQAAGDIGSAQAIQGMIKGIVSSLTQMGGGMGGGGMGGMGGGGGGGGGFGALGSNY